MMPALRPEFFQRSLALTPKRRARLRVGAIPIKQSPTVFGYEGKYPLDSPRGFAPGANTAPVPPDAMTAGWRGGEVFSGGLSACLASPCDAADFFSAGILVKALAA
jgi:hypothetical protein